MPWTLPLLHALDLPYLKPYLLTLPFMLLPHALDLTLPNPTHTQKPPHPGAGGKPLQR